MSLINDRYSEQCPSQGKSSEVLAISWIIAIWMSPNKNSVVGVGGKGGIEK